MPMTGTPRMTRVLRLARLAALGAAPLAALVAFSHDARAQIAGTTNRPLPNVLLLVDTSGSMERMPDNSLPSQNRDPVTGGTIAVGPGVPGNACIPGTASNPNRWGMLLQALTGNLQPYFSCDGVQRTSNAFKNEFKINSVQPYDADYFLPYHRPLTGTTTDACAYAPYTLGGVATGGGVGPGARGINTAPYTDARSFPPDAFTEVLNSHLVTQYSTGTGSNLSLPANACKFEQANDGQLDATRDYIRFGLMTFDNDPSAALGVVTASPPGGGVDTANPFLGQWSYVKSGTNPLALALGLPAGCTTGSTPFEVGARHWAAPPWEGRMVPFPDPDGNVYDIQRTNDEIQKVLLGTRPYGATPIDGMMEDARDYFWYNQYGPLGSTSGYRDNYVVNSCRDQYIVLLTDGAPNMDLRPACEGAGPPAGICPYPNKAAAVANAMAMAAGNQHVKTFVIGFSVNGAGNASFTNDGFPTGTNSAPNNNCKAWYNVAGGNPTAMRTACTAQNPPKGSTAEACCILNEIAYYGSAPTYDVGPFFAETQADLVLSFGRILGGVSKSATTRTLPGYAPPVSVSGQGVTGDFVASFIPNAQKVWSGEIDRTRSVCVGPTPTPQTQTVAAGDSFAANTAAQTAAGKRLFISVKAPVTTAVAPFSGNVVDSARTIRPWTDATGTLQPAYSDGIPDSFGSGEVVGLDMGLAATSDWTEAMDIDDNTCKRSRAVTGLTIPRLLKNDCKQVIWGFATAHSASQGPLVYNGYDFNVRCKGGASATSGFCSVSGAGCNLLTTPCTGAGEVCVPECSALGAIYRSSPVIVGPPTELLRDEAYRAYSQQRRQRRPTMFVATTDGVLHAFKALSSSAPPAFDATANEQELWSFIPPAVLPKLASNYPTGQQILLDGTVAVKDIVWDRPIGAPYFNLPEAFHTTLVSGMGAGGGGYYALNVSDVDCQGASTPGNISNAPNGCLGGFTPATTFTDVRNNVKGPQFLWQLTDIPEGSGDPAKKTRLAKDGTQFVALFGKESGNAAVTTLQFNPDGTGVRQIGVAILPGGIDGPPVKGGTCARAINGGALTPFLPTDYDASDNTRPLAPRPSVRQWGTGGANPCLNAPVPGRSVTIVRADTGEIIRHFGRVGQDVPQRILGVTTNSPFDSPVIGTPAVYPNQLGVPAQKIFVGDADGTIWRIDVSSTNPANWKVQLFQDLGSKDIPGTPGALDSQPVQIPPVVTLDPFGGVVVTAATGDQENIIASTTEKNWIMSIQEQRAISTTQLGRAQVRWYKEFTNAERVTGPMTVFDRTVYFATYQPVVPTSGACTNGGTAYLWGMDYFSPVGGVVGTNAGGLPRWCPIGRVDPVSGACLDPLTDKENPATTYPSLLGAIVPGVTIRASQACATFSGPASDPLITGLTSTRFDLFFGATAKGTGGAGTGAPQAARPTSPLTRPLPRSIANIDAWAFVID